MTKEVYDVMQIGHGLAVLQFQSQVDLALVAAMMIVCDERADVKPGLILGMTTRMARTVERVGIRSRIVESTCTEAISLIGKGAV